MMRGFPVAALALCVAPLVLGMGDGDAPPKEMGFADVLAWALDHSDMIRAAQAGTEALLAKVTQAEWAAWPHADGRFIIAPMPSQHGGPGDTTTDYSVWGVFTQTEVSGWLPLFTFNKIKHLKTAARSGVDVGRAVEEVARAELRFRLQKAFFGLSLARELFATIDEGRGYMTKARKHVEELEAAEDPSLDPVDKLKLRVAEAQVKARDLEARRAMALAEATIRAVAALPEGQELAFRVGQPAPVQPLQELSLAEMVAKAIEGRPELKALRKGIAAREAEVRLKRVAFFPDLVLGAQFTYAYSNAWYRTGVDDPTNGYWGRAGLMLKWDFEIGRKLSELREAQANLAKLKAEEQEAERGVRLEVEKLFREASDARQLVDSMKDAMDAARGWVIAKIDLYENDLAEMSDVTYGLVQFFQSRIDYLKAIHDYNVALAALERSAGLKLIPDVF